MQIPRARGCDDDVTGVKRFAASEALKASCLSPGYQEMTLPLRAALSLFLFLSSLSSL